MNRPDEKAKLDSIEEARSVTRAAGIVGGATLLSRILGFARDMVIAYFFGTASTADAFFVAFRLPNLLRRLFAEGSFTVAFIPVFTESLTHQGREAALEIARSVLTALGLVLVLISFLGILFAPAVIHVIAPGFTQDPGKLSLTVSLTRITFPYIFFIGLVAGCMGVLNSLRHFAAPALAPTLLNLSMIGSVALLHSWLEEPVYALAWGVLIGGLLQLLLQIPFMVKLGFSLVPLFRFDNPALKRILYLMLPSALGAAVYQVSILLSTLLASLLPSGSVSYLYYADRVVQFPLGVFAIALGTASLPSMSRFAAKGDIEGLINTFSHSLRLVLFIAVPSMAGLVVLRDPIVSVLFQRGAFDADASVQTSSALLYYAVGLWAFSGIRIVLSAFFSLQDTSTPVKVAILSLVAGILFSLVLMGPMRHNGLALATSLSSALNLGLLMFLLRKKTGRMDGRRILASLVKTTAATCCMALSVVVASLAPLPGGIAVRLTSRLAIGFIVYLGVAFLLRSDEVQTLFSPIYSRITRAITRKT
ncbi:MAG: murein biosynthesis integral membrane protein MurJ [Deltaproteobacteria bacterium]|nr:murein biosynthesis integral membrane protein MurJ [Deltaproteobacteria bacterium]